MQQKAIYIKEFKVFYKNRDLTKTIVKVHLLEAFCGDLIIIKSSNASGKTTLAKAIFETLDPSVFVVECEEMFVEPKAFFIQSWMREEHFHFLHERMHEYKLLICDEFKPDKEKIVNLAIEKGLCVVLLTANYSSSFKGAKFFEINKKSKSLIPVTFDETDMFFSIPEKTNNLNTVYPGVNIAICTDEEHESKLVKEATEKGFICITQKVVNCLSFSKVQTIKMFPHIFTSEMVALKTALLAAERLEGCSSGLLLVALFMEATFKGKKIFLSNLFCNLDPKNTELIVERATSLNLTLVVSLESMVEIESFSGVRIKNRNFKGVRILNG